MINITKTEGRTIEKKTLKKKIIIVESIKSSQRQPSIMLETCPTIYLEATLVKPTLWHPILILIHDDVSVYIHVVLPPIWIC